MSCSVSVIRSLSLLQFRESECLKSNAGLLEEGVS